MSLLEQKRLQWAAERDEVSNEWNPWGRPGCGAPCAVSFTSASTMVTPQQISMWQREHSNSSGGVAADLSLPLHISCTPNDLTSGGGMRGAGTKLPPLPSVSPPHQRASSLVSSTSLGYNNNSNNNPFIYTYAYDMWKEEAKKQWLHELNKQREEQRLKRLPINLSKQVLNEPNLVPTSAVPLEPPATFIYASSSAESPSLSNFDSSASTAQWNNTKTFLRGANVPLDPSTQNELTLRRAKALEQQEAIRVQIEERKRVRERERAEEKRREMEEELRLAKETDHAPSAATVNRNYAKVADKSEHKVAAPSPPPAAPPQSVKPEVGVCLPDVLDGAFTNLPKATPSAPPGEHHVETSTAVVEEYVVNRVLTPTKYRGHPVFRRDCATQTDFKSEGGFPFKKDASTCTKKNNPKDVKNNESRLKGSQRGIQKRRGEVQKKPQPLPPPPTRSSRRSDDARSSRTKANNSTRLPAQHSQSRKSQLSEVSGGTREMGSGGRNQSSRTRSRSSAEYQRTFIADESNAASSRNNQRRSVSPVSRVNLTGGDSSTCDDEGGDVGRGVRRKRRQWESPPPRHLLPHFYTDSPPQLTTPDRRRGSLGTSGSTKPLSRSTPKINHAPDALVPIIRSDSPPVPALRRLQLAQEDWNLDGTGSLRDLKMEPREFKVAYREDAESELNANLDKMEPASRFIVEPAASRYQVEPNQFKVYREEEEDAITPTREFQVEPTTRFQVDPNGGCKVDPNGGCKADAGRELLDSGLDESEQSLLSSSSGREDILRKLSIIRHNLCLKQTEVDDMGR